MPIDQHQFEFVCSKAREAMMLQSSADLLEWDERTGMPIAAGEYRARQVARLRGLAHQLRTDPDYGEQLQTLLHDSSDEPPHSQAVATIRELHRDWDRDHKLPIDLIQRAAEATVRGQQSWDAAKKADDYSMFRDTLDTILSI
ncbi:MAG: carboxypeptidase M32, partial [Planctomycetes bacterium]|nr:carboxypeptidase M32 [Planctomycetota bacterium]